MKIKQIPKKYDVLLDLLSSLSDRDIKILTLRYQRMNQQDVAQMFSITKERVRQLEDRALKVIDKKLGSLLGD